MPSHSIAEIGSLIQPGRVHRRVYGDPDIFELRWKTSLDALGFTSVTTVRSKILATLSPQRSDSVRWC